MFPVVWEMSLSKPDHERGAATALIAYGVDLSFGYDAHRDMINALIDAVCADPTQSLELINCSRTSNEPSTAHFVVEFLTRRLVDHTEEVSKRADLDSIVLQRLSIISEAVLAGAGIASILGQINGWTAIVVLAIASLAGVVTAIVRWKSAIVSRRAKSRADVIRALIERIVDTSNTSMR